MTRLLRDSQSSGMMVNGSWMLSRTWLTISALYESTPRAMTNMAGSEVTTRPILYARVRGSSGLPR